MKGASKWARWTRGNAVDGTITGGETARRVKVGVASASLLRVLGARTALGRWFLPEEVSFARDVITDPVVVVSGEFWREQLGADPGVLGTTLELNERSLTIPPRVQPNAPVAETDSRRLLWSWPC